MSKKCSPTVGQGEPPLVPTPWAAVPLRPPIFFQILPAYIFLWGETLYQEPYSKTPSFFDDFAEILVHSVCLMAKTKTPFSKVQHVSSPIATVTCCLASSTAFITTLLWFL